jgi:hypothetical protein
MKSYRDGTNGIGTGSKCRTTPVIVAGVVEEVLLVSEDVLLVPDDVPVMPDVTINWVLAWLLPLELVAVRTYCVEVPGAIAVDPVFATLPIPGWMFTVVAFETFQLKVEDDPAVILPGDILNELIAGRPVEDSPVPVLALVPVPATAICVEAVVSPAALVAVRIYVVVVAGVTALVPLTATFPIPLSRLTLLAPLTVQLRVELPPGFMLVGLALNEAITGGFFAGVHPGK